jgi:hypothetical protein
MAPVMGITFFALLLIVPVAILVVLGVFKLIAWLGNSLLGRTNTVHDEHRGLGFRPMIAGAIAGAIPICLIVLVLVLFKVRSAHSVQVIPPSAAQASPVLIVDEPQVALTLDGPVLIEEHWANQSQEVLQAVQQPNGLIPVDSPIEVPIEASKPAPDPLASQLETASTPAEEPVQPATVEPANAAASSALTGETPAADVAATPAVTTTESTSAESKTAEPATTTTNSAEVTPVDPTPADTAEQKTSVDEPTSTSADVAAEPAAETPAQRQARLTELASHISPWIRSLLNEARPEENAVAADVAEAVESSDKQIVVFQLAGPIRQKYALIPLTPAFDAALSPVTPFLANGSLESIAESLAMFLKRPAKTPTEVSASTGGTETPAVAEPQSIPTKDASVPTTVAMAETTGDSKGNAALTAGEQLAEVLVGEETPAWVDSPQPHQFVVRSAALFPGESTVAPLNKAINEVLPEQLKLYEESLEPALRAQARLVKLELDEKTSQACVVQTFERLQTVGKEGSDKQNMRFVYALVELPESVKTAAVQTVRMSLQRDRVTGLAVIIGLAWLAICAASVVVRLWGRGGFFRKMVAIPILCLICIPLLLLAVGTGAATAGIPGSNMPRYPWADSSKPIRIQV